MSKREGERESSTMMKLWTLLYLLGEFDSTCIDLAQLHTDQCSRARLQVKTFKAHFRIAHMQRPQGFTLDCIYSITLSSALRSPCHQVCSCMSLQGSLEDSRSGAGGNVEDTDLNCKITGEEKVSP